MLRAPRFPSDLDAPVRGVPCRTLTAEGFAPFGAVVAAGDPAEGAVVNEGRGRRWDVPAALDAADGTRPRLAVYRLSPSPLPASVATLERHPRSVQAFLPLSPGRFLVVACPDRPDGEPDAGRLRAFVGGPGQGVVYRRGTWHHPMVALDGPMDFAMLIWEGGDSRDCETRALGRAREVVPERDAKHEGGRG